jgi:chromosome partitioning protein
MGVQSAPKVALVDSAAVARVFAIANQKGGVAKTTTAQTVGLALADLGERVLLVDLDPQACLTFALGLEPEACTPTLHDVLLARVKADDAIVDAGRVRLLPANIDLAGSELHLLTRTGREHTLARALDSVRGKYDTVLIDCPPSLGVLTVNGLTAADEVLVPLQCEALGHRGVAQLLETVADVREFTNPRLRVRGVIATMFDPRGRHAREVLDDVKTRFGLPVLDPPIPKTVRFAEAPGRGISILEHAPQSAGAQAYRAIAALLHGNERETDGREDDGRTGA